MANQLWSTTVDRLGELTHELIEGGCYILFGEPLPEALAEISIVLIYDLTMISHPAGGQVTFTSFSPAPLLTPVVGSLLVIAIAGFVGFEATVVLSEEAKDPKRTIARATHWAVIIAAFMCSISAWAMAVTTGPENIAATAGEHQTDLVDMDAPRGNIGRT